MLKTIKLLLPALMPSWRFFDVIAPSPRLQYALFDPDTNAQKEWQEFRPRPAKISFIQMLKRLVWNPDWNESLFMVSCAEHILDGSTKFHEGEILERISRSVGLSQNSPNSTHLQFRIVVVERKGEVIDESVEFLSTIQVLGLPASKLEAH